MDTVWSSKGYRVPKTPELLVKVKKDLTLWSEAQQMVPGPKDKVICFKADEKYIYTPYHYGEKNWGKPKKRFKADVHTFQHTFNGEMRPYQKDIVDKTLKHFQETTRGGLLALGTGLGKCLHPNTLVVMSDGRTRRACDISLGDKLMGDDSTPRTVLSVTAGREPMYRIDTSDGEHYIVNRSHILSLKVNGKIVDIPMNKLLTENVSKYKGYRVPMELPEVNIDGDPYEMGNTFSWKVPDCIRYNSIRVRKLFLAGFVDSYRGLPCALGYKLEVDIPGIKNLARSVGLRYSKLNSGKILLVGSLPTRYCKHKPIEYNLEYDITITSLGEGDYFGFEIDGNRRFLLEDFTVTHNTAIAIYLASILGLRTLIVVHKQILLDQWLDRLRQFLPTMENVGRVQGEKNEIDDCDIIVGMVQTMTRREYHYDAFKSIGLIIVDECHNMCSKTFNEIFFKVQARYRLGLSATPNRKDGFDKALEYHIGPIICEMSMTIVEPFVTVYFLEENDQVVMSLTRFGKTNFPALVTDLGQNEKRNVFLSKIILEKVRENRKILLLSDRVYQCETLHEIFKRNCKSGHRSDTFLGKKTRDQLEIAMGADVIFATYGTFKEGVDCPDLDTLVFGTPKTDIVQALGRILRQKNKNKPEIIDVVDTIEPLKMQYYKRNRYYKSKDYEINYINECDLK